MILMESLNEENALERSKLSLNFFVKARKEDILFLIYRCEVKRRTIEYKSIRVFAGNFK